MQRKSDKFKVNFTLQAGLLQMILNNYTKIIIHITVSGEFSNKIIIHITVTVEFSNKIKIHITVSVEFSNKIIIHITVSGEIFQ